MGNRITHTCGNKCERCLRMRRRGVGGQKRGYHKGRSAYGPPLCTDDPDHLIGPCRAASRKSRTGSEPLPAALPEMPRREIGWEWTGRTLTALAAYQPSHLPHVGSRIV